MFDTAALLSGDTTAATRFDFGTAVPNGFTFSQDGRYLYGTLVLHRRLERVPLRPAREEGRSAHEHRDRLLPAHSARRWSAPGVPLYRTGVRSRLDRSEADRGRQPDHLPRRAPRRREAGAQDVDAGLTREGPLRHDGETDRRLSPRWRAAPRVVLPLRRGLQGHGRCRRRVQSLRPADAQPAPVRGGRVARLRPAGKRAGSPVGGLLALRLAGERHVQPRRLLRSLRPDEGLAQGIPRARRTHEHAHLRRAADAWSSTSAVRWTAISIGCPITRTCRSTSRPW